MFPVALRRVPPLTGVALIAVTGEFVLGAEIEVRRTATVSRYLRGPSLPRLGVDRSGWCSVGQQRERIALAGCTGSVGEHSAGASGCAGGVGAVIHSGPPATAGDQDPVLRRALSALGTRAGSDVGGTAASARGVAEERSIETVAVGEGRPAGVTTAIPAAASDVEDPLAMFPVAVEAVGTPMTCTADIDLQFLAGGHLEHRDDLAAGSAQGAGLETAGEESAAASSADRLDEEGIDVFGNRISLRRAGVGDDRRRGERCGAERGSADIPRARRLRVIGGGSARDGDDPRNNGDGATADEARARPHDSLPERGARDGTSPFWIIGVLAVSRRRREVPRSAGRFAHPAGVSSRRTCWSGRIADEHPFEVLVAQGEHRAGAMAVHRTEVLAPHPVDAKARRAEHDHAGDSGARCAHPAQSTPQVGYMIAMRHMVDGDTQIAVQRTRLLPAAQPDLDETGCLHDLRHDHQATSGRKARITCMHSIEKVVTRTRMGDDSNDREFWRSQTPEERVAHLVQLRRDFEGWTYETEPGLPRVARVLRRS
jgi:hypothetical protein